MCLRCPHCQVQRGIEILVDDQARGWGLTDVDAFSEVHLLFDVTTPRTPLRRREPAIGQEQAFPLPHTLVAHLSPEFAQVHIARFEAFAALGKVAPAVAEAIEFLDAERPVHTKTGWSVFDLRGEFLHVRRVLTALKPVEDDRPNLLGALARAHIALEVEEDGADTERAAILTQAAVLEKQEAR